MLNTRPPMAVFEEETTADKMGVAFSSDIIENFLCEDEDSRFVASIDMALVAFRKGYFLGISREEADHNYLVCAGVIDGYIISRQIFVSMETNEQINVQLLAVRKNGSLDRYIYVFTNVEEEEFRLHACDMQKREVPAHDYISIAEVINSIGAGTEWYDYPYPFVDQKAYLEWDFFDNTAREKSLTTDYQPFEALDRIMAKVNWDSLPPQ